MDIEQTWTDLMRQLKSYPTINASQIDAFFSRVQIQAASPGFIMLTSDNAFIKDWIEKHYLKDIQKALSDLYNLDFQVLIEVDPTAAAPAQHLSPHPQRPLRPLLSHRKRSSRNRHPQQQAHRTRLFQASSPLTPPRPSPPIR